ncbi:MAG: DUF2127 domain-containing protein [Patescibacteria group bacterium]
MNVIKNIIPERFIRHSFTVTIILKGLNGILEIASGFILFFIHPSQVSGLVFKLTQFELNEDPTDFIANYLVGLANDFSLSVQFFSSIFLLSHGIIKLALLIALWKKKIWAYPTAMIVFSIFIAYQAYRYSLYHSTGLILLSILDALIIILTYLEYQRIKRL